MRIRPAEARDIGEIAALYAASHRETYRGLLPEAYFETLTPAHVTEKWADHLNAPGRMLWVARGEEGLLGFAAGMPDASLPDTWLLDSLHVAPSARGRGVGSALIRVCGAHAAGAGYARMSVCIVRGNDRARALYVKLGARHLTYFDDAFGPVVSHSEKLIWDQPPGVE